MKEKIFKYIGLSFIAILLAPLLLMFIRSFIHEDSQTTLLDQNEKESSEHIFSTKCASCHGIKGDGGEGIPLIAGQNAEILKTKLLNYKYGNANDSMKLQANALSDSMIEKISHYISTLKPKEKNSTIEQKDREKKREMKFDTSGMNS